VNDHKAPLVNDGLLEKRKYKRLLMYDIVMLGNCPLFYRLEGGPTRDEYEARKAGQLKPDESKSPHQPHPAVQIVAPHGIHNRNRIKGQDTIQRTKDYFQKRFNSYSK